MAAVQDRDAIQVYTMREKDAWEARMEQFAGCDVYYLPGYADAFAKNGDGEPLLLYYEADGRRAASVVMKRPVPVRRILTPEDRELRACCDLVTPYGYGGFLLEGDWDAAHKRRLYDAYEAHLRRERVVAEFVRFHPGLNNAHQVDDFYEVVDLGATVQMELSSRDVIWQNLSSKNRNMIRKAQKSGVRIYWGRSPRLYREFREMYDRTMDRAGAEAYYYFGEAFYESLLEELKDRAMVFYAVHEEQTVAMSILLTGKTGVHYHLSASRAEYRHLAPTNLLLYEAACYACAQGYRTFHLGGGLGSRKDALYRFKKQFFRGGDRVFSIGRKIYDAQAYDRLCVLNEPDPESGFFPKYRSGLES